MLYPWYQIDPEPLEGDFHYITNVEFYNDEDYTDKRNKENDSLSLDPDQSLMIDENVPVSPELIYIRVTLNHEFITIYLNSSFILEVCGYHQPVKNFEDVYLEYNNDTLITEYDY